MGVGPSLGAGSSSTQWSRVLLRMRSAGCRRLSAPTIAPSHAILPGQLEEATCLSTFAGSDVGRTRSATRTATSAAGPCSPSPTVSAATRAARSPRRRRWRRWPPSTAASSPTPPGRRSPGRGHPGGNTAILDQAAGDPDLWGMGTTVTAAAVAGDRHLQLAHVGDSRAYLFRDGSLEAHHRPHRGRRAGPPWPPHPEQAAVHPERILTRAVGLDRIPVDTPDPWSSPPATRSSSAPTASPRRPDAKIAQLRCRRARRRRGLPFPDRRRQLRRRPRQHHGGPSAG